MTRNKKIAALVLVLLIVGFGLVLFFANNGDDEPEATPTPVATPSARATAASSPSGTQGGSQPEAVTVRFTDDGFSPQTVTVKSGQSITFTNDSDRTVEPSSDPHPTHTTNPQLNVGDLAPGQSKTITPTRTGSWGMHDHLQPSLKLTVVVQ